MAGDGDFYTRDRPDNPDLPEDRPRGGGPEDAQHGRTWPIWALAVALVLLILLMTLMWGI